MHELVAEPTPTTTKLLAFQTEPAMLQDAIFGLQCLHISIVCHSAIHMVRALDLPD